MLLTEAEDTLWVASASLKEAQRACALNPDGADGYFLETLGVDKDQREGIRSELREASPEGVDPVVRYIVGHTCGCPYRSLSGKLSRYPIPEPRLPSGNGDLFLEIGCNWGRWCIAASRKGYAPVGIDPSLGAVMAARRVAAQLDVPGRFVVADGRYLPFRAGRFDVVFSYSVLQHFSKDNAKLALAEVARVLKNGGASLIQMPNRFGVRSLQHQIRAAFREETGFDIRYWTLPELRRVFSELIGLSSIQVDGYFGLGIQPRDKDLLPAQYRLVVNCSEALRTLSRTLPWMKYFADSVYVTSVRQRQEHLSDPVLPQSKMESPLQHRPGAMG